MTTATAATESTATQSDPEQAVLNAIDIVEDLHIDTELSTSSALDEAFERTQELLDALKAVEKAREALAEHCAKADAKATWICCENVGEEVEYEDCTADEAARQYVEDGLPVEQTTWAHVVVRPLHLPDAGWESHTVAIHPEEPDCADWASGHDWRSPEFLGGCSENPGVWGHGGGVISHEVCIHCGAERVTDTWAQDPVTGEQGLTSIRYGECDLDALKQWRLTHVKEPCGEVEQSDEDVMGCRVGEDESGLWWCTDYDGKIWGPFADQVSAEGDI